MTVHIFGAKVVLKQPLGCEDNVTDQLSLAVGRSFNVQIKRNRPESMPEIKISNYIGIQISEFN